MVTAAFADFPHTRTMQRLVDEAEYVLTVLYRIRDTVSANPKLFDPDARRRIDEAITRTEAVLRSTRSEWSVEQQVKAA